MATISQSIPIKTSHLNESREKKSEQQKDAQAGIRFGNYEILSLIGKGEFGAVYKARQISLNRIVALKVMKKKALASELEVKMFKREAQALAAYQAGGAKTVEARERLFAAEPRGDGVFKDKKVLRRPATSEGFR